MGKATEDLRSEHRSVLFAIKVINKMAESDKSDQEMLVYYGEMVYFLKIFADQCHHGKEENYLFETLKGKGDREEDALVAELLGEHEQGRELIATMNQGVETSDAHLVRSAAASYGILMTTHIEQEDNVLFPFADEVLKEEEQDEMFEQFEAWEENVVGHGVHEKLHELIHNWAETFDVE